MFKQMMDGEYVYGMLFFLKRRLFLQKLEYSFERTKSSEFAELHYLYKNWREAYWLNLINAPLVTRTEPFRSPPFETGTGKSFVFISDRSTWPTKPWKDNPYPTACKVKIVKKLKA